MLVCEVEEDEYYDVVLCDLYCYWMSVFMIGIYESVYLGFGKYIFVVFIMIDFMQLIFSMILLDLDNYLLKLEVFFMFELGVMLIFFEFEEVIRFIGCCWEFRSCGSELNFLYLVIEEMWLVKIKSFV